MSNGVGTFTYLIPQTLYEQFSTHEIKSRGCVVGFTDLGVLLFLVRNVIKTKNTLLYKKQWKQKQYLYSLFCVNVDCFKETRSATNCYEMFTNCFYYQNRSINMCFANNKSKKYQKWLKTVFTRAVFTADRQFPIYCL